MRLNKRDYDKHLRIVRTQNVIRLSKVFLFFVALIMSIIVVYNFDFDIINNQKLIQSGAYLIGPECGNMSFQETAICLNNFARENFYYNLTDDSLILTIQEMIERGGDCKDWTNFYEVNMAHYGFSNSQRVKIFVEKEKVFSIYHVYLNIGHTSGYCNMDIKDLECYQYANDDGEVREELEFRIV